jgi:hypothetical protein
MPPKKIPYLLIRFTDATFICETIEEKRVIIDDGGKKLLNLSLEEIINAWAMVGEV